MRYKEVQSSSYAWIGREYMEMSRTKRRSIQSPVHVLFLVHKPESQLSTFSSVGSDGISISPYDSRKWTFLPWPQVICCISSHHRSIVRIELLSSDLLPLFSAISLLCSTIWTAEETWTNVRGAFTTVTDEHEYFCRCPSFWFFLSFLCRLEGVHLAWVDSKYPLSIKIAGVRWYNRSYKVGVDSLAFAIEGSDKSADNRATIIDRGCIWFHEESSRDDRAVKERRVWVPIF